MSHRIDQQLVADALQMAIYQGRPPPGLIQHSDQGQRYIASAYRTVFEDGEQARSAIFEYTEVFYNRQRLHELPGFKSSAPHEAKTTVA
jgi:putative transposase